MIPRITKPRLTAYNEAKAAYETLVGRECVFFQLPGYGRPTIADYQRFARRAAVAKLYQDLTGDRVGALQFLDGWNNSMLVSMGHPAVPAELLAELQS